MLPYVIETFEFRVLRQNRRVVKSDDADRTQELEKFHRVLNDISWGKPSDDVRLFLVEAYVRGARSNCAELTPFEGSTGVFTKRRYRDRFNRTMVKRVGQECRHQLKVKARVRTKGTRGANWSPGINQQSTPLSEFVVLGGDKGWESCGGWCGGWGRRAGLGELAAQGMVRAA